MSNAFSRILIADDDDDRAALCRQLLLAQGYDVEVIVGSGSPTTSSAAASGPIVVVLVAEHLLDIVRERLDAPLIVFSPEPGDHLDDERASVWVNTPVEPTALLRAVEDLLDTDGRVPR